MLTDLKKTIEEITLKKIMRRYPEAAEYKSMISFHHNAGTASMNLDLLPADLVKKIEALFE